MNSLFSSLVRNDGESFHASLEDVQNYVKAGTVLVQKGTKCVDGRYLPHQGRGMLSRPGADCGYVMALEAVNRKKNLGLTPHDCFNFVFNAVKKLNGEFYFHTDDYERNSIGCDHVASAARHGFSWEYDVRSKDVKEMVNCVKNLSQGVKMIRLTGEHYERGVIIICSNKYTVVADNPKRHQMFRIYDVDRDRVFMKQLVKEMNIKGVKYEDMIHEADLQFDATLQNLAVGLPIYKVEFSDTTPTVTYLNRVEYKPLFKRMHMPPASYFTLPRFTR